MSTQVDQSSEPQWQSTIDIDISRQWSKQLSKMRGKLCQISQVLLTSKMPT